MGADTTQSITRELNNIFGPAISRADALDFATTLKWGHSKDAYGQLLYLNPHGEVGRTLDFISCERHLNKWFQYPFEGDDRNQDYLTPENPSHVKGMEFQLGRAALILMGTHLNGTEYSPEQFLEAVKQFRRDHTDEVMRLAREMATHNIQVGSRAVETYKKERLNPLLTHGTVAATALLAGVAGRDKISEHFHRLTSTAPTPSHIDRLQAAAAPTIPQALLDMNDDDVQDYAKVRKALGKTGEPNAQGVLFEITKNIGGNIATEFVLDTQEDFAKAKTDIIAARAARQISR